jgi:hypothetical protein
VPERATSTPAPSNAQRASNALQFASTFLKIIARA